MFDTSVLVNPAEVLTDLTAALDAQPTRATRGGTAAQSSTRLRTLAILSRRVEALLLAEIASFDDQGFALACGAKSTGAYLAAHTHLDPPTAGRLVLAARTADRMPQLGAMLATGTIGVEHLTAVAYATRKVPEHIVTAQDTTFAALAEAARPSDLRVAGQHLRRLYDADALERDANHARESRYLTLSPTFNDVYHLEGQLTAEDGAALAVALESLMTPTGDEDLRTITQRRADALTELTELALRSAKLPEYGGDRPRVTLLVKATTNPFVDPDDPENPLGGRTDDPQSVARLTRGLHDITGSATGSGAGTRYSQSAPDTDIDTEAEAHTDELRTVPAGAVQLSVTAFNHGDAQLLASTHTIPHTVLARICCEADLNMATLDATGHILNLGRTSRNPNIHQRRAVIIRDRHCVFPGCDIPPERCQVHHLNFWTRDQGPTNLNNLAVVCWFHHRLVHEHHWTLAADPPSKEHPTGGWKATAPDGHHLTQHDP